MGASPYMYLEQFDGDVEATLHALREREFRAGRYNPVISFPVTPINENSPAPGAQHQSIEEALDDADADGARCILDLDHISEEPELCAACPIPAATLEEHFGTAQLTRAVFEAEQDAFWDIMEEVDRGTGVYTLLYDDNGEPNEIVFAGYSFD